jgi:uncharacterized protein involved in exopolysaccharide biosynthesis
MQAETQKISSSINTSGRVSKGKQSELQAAIEAHKKRILDLRMDRDEVSVLQQDVDSAQRAYEAINLRYNQSNLESNSTQTNVSVLTPATPPLEPSTPKVLLNVLIAIFLGTLLAVGAALILELLDRRVRSAEDLEQSLGLPVLADLAPSTRKPGFFARFNRRKTVPIVAA